MSENNRYNMLSSDDREEAIRIKKMRQGVIPDTENEEYIKEKQKQQEIPVSFKEKIQNFWYHYKWTTIVVTFFAIAIGFLTYQAVTTEKYDTTIMICSNTFFSDEDLNSVAENFGEYIGDVDKNGKVSVGVVQSSYNEALQNDGYIGLDEAMKARIMAEIASGENCIFVVENSVLDYLSQKGVFLDLREELSIKSESEVYSVSLENSNILSHTDFEKIKDNYSIAIRVHKKGIDEKLYNTQLNAVKEIYNNK